MGCFQMNPFVATLVTLFGIGAWISINGIWVELPLLVSLPEQWALPSYLSIIIQIANIGPITFSLLKVLQPNTKPAPYIYFILVIGSLASFFLIFFWDETSVIGGEMHSTALFVLVFFLALVDCTSSVLYLPYMALWKSHYLPVYSMGEGLSGLLPAVVALIQGIGDDSSGGNGTNTTNVTELYEQTPEMQANFSISTFFAILFLMMLISGISFSFLDLLPKIQSERENVEKLEDTNENIHKSPSPAHHVNHGFSGSTEPNAFVPHVARTLSDASDLSDSSNIGLTNSSYFQWPRHILLSLLFGQLFASMLTNGFLPSIQSYSCVPYGNTAYHWSAIIAAVANPIAATTTALFKSRVKLPTMIILGVIGTFLASYIIVVSAMSPNPPLEGTTLGSVLIVLTWGAFTYIMTLVRVEINNLLRVTEGPKGEKVLFWSGGCTQLGSFFGALTAFILVNVAGVFHQ